MAGEIWVYHAFPCTSRIVLELILVILRWCKKYPPKNLFSEIWLPSYRAKKELNNFTSQDESLLYRNLAQMIIVGDTIGWLEIALLPSPLSPQKSLFGPLCISLVVLIGDTKLNCQTSQGAQLSIAMILPQSEQWYYHKVSYTFSWSQSLEQWMLS